MFIGEWNKSVILTYVGLTFALVGICCVHSGGMEEAYACLIGAGICDLFDGAVARRCKRNEAQKLFGIQLDSLVDVMSFLALPVTIGIGVGMRRWYHILVLVWFSVCGIARLAFFNVNSETSGKKDEPVSYYRGLPVTYTALIFPLVYLLKFALSPVYFIILYTMFMAGVALLNILDIKVKKPRGMAYLFFALLAMVLWVVYLIIL